MEIKTAERIRITFVSPEKWRWRFGHRRKRHGRKMISQAVRPSRTNITSLAGPTAPQLRETYGGIFSGSLTLNAHVIVVMADWYQARRCPCTQHGTNQAVRVLRRRPAWTVNANGRTGRQCAGMSFPMPTRSKAA